MYTDGNSSCNGLAEAINGGAIASSSEQVGDCGAVKRAVCLKPGVSPVVAAS
jgi:hypothetical protein